MRLALISLLTSIVLSVPAVRAQPPSSRTSDDVESLIQQLSSDDFRKRQSAHERLVQLGDSVRERLARVVKETTDEEVRTRAESALAQIADNAVNGPSLITMHFTDVPPQVVFAELSRQCGRQLEPAKPDLFTKKPLPNISIAVTREPFWEAMIVLSERTGLRLTMNDQRCTLSSGEFSDANGIRCVSGPFLIVANSIQRNRTIGMGRGRPSEAELSIAVTVLAEPKIRVVSAASTVTLEEAVDENGNSLIIPTSKDRPSVANPSGRWTLNIPLRIPNANAGSSIVRLKGHIDVLIQSRSTPVEFADLAGARNITKHVAGLQVVLSEMRSKSDKYELSLSLVANQGAQVDRNQLTQRIATDMRLLDENGNAFIFAGCSPTTRPDRLELVVRFRKPKADENPQKVGEPVRATWNLPSAARQIAVPFEFKDLPIQ